MVKLKIFLAGLLLVAISTLPATAQVYYLVGATLKTKEASNGLHRKHLGIKADADGGLITVKMFSKSDYESAESDIGLIYGVRASSNSIHNNTYSTEYWQITNETWIPLPMIDNRQSTRFEPVITQLINRANQNGKYMTRKGGEFEVIVTLKLEGNVTIQNVSEVRLPGGITLTRDDFINKSHYCNSHPGAIPCQALAQIRDHGSESVIVNAHRGVYGKPGIVENSMGSLQNAYEADYVLIEMDIMETKDGVLILNHDKGPHRVMDVSNVARNPDNTEEYVHFKDLYYHQPNPGMFTGGLPLKDIKIKDRYGNVVNETLKTLEDALVYVKDKDILLKIDPKRTENIETYTRIIGKVLELGKQHNCLHQLIITVLSLNNGLVMMPNDMKVYLGNELWDDLSTRTNVNVVVYEGDAAYVKEWVEIPSVITYEVSFRQIDYENDPLILVKPELDNMNIMKYVDSKGKKLSVFQQNPIERRGTGDNGHWRDVYRNTFQGSWEHIIRVNREFGKIGTYTADRPDMIESYLRALGIFNGKTFRSDYNQ